MEGTQESSSKPLTKSSRKRLRKRQAAALEKFILASEAAGSCKIEPTQGSNPESVEIRGCLSNIVFHNNSVGEKEFFVSNNSPHDIVNTKTKSVCCEGSENVLLEKNRDTKQESFVLHSKRKRNGKKGVVTEISSDNPGDAVISKSQKSVETKSTQHHGASQKDCTKQERSVLSSINHTIVQAPIVAKKDKKSNKVEADDKLDNVTNFKQQEETDDKASTLSRSKRRRNRKKATVLSEQSDTLDQSVDDKGVKSQETPECPPQLFTQQLSSQIECTPGQRLGLNPSISIGSGIPASETKICPVKNNRILKCVETAAGKIGKDTAKKEGKLQLSKFPENLDDISKKTCDPSHKSLSEEKKGISVKEAKVQKCQMNIENKQTATVVSDSVEPKGYLVCQKEQGQSSFVFQKSGDCPPTNLCVGTENYPAGMEGTQKNISKLGQVPKENNNQDKGENKVTFISKYGSAVKKVDPCQCNEVDRAAVGKIEIRSLPESSIDTESISKKEDNMKVMSENRTVVGKGSGIIRKVAPIDITEVCTDNIKIEEKLEPPKKDDDSASASPEAADMLKEKVKAEREARKAAKLAKKQKDKTPAEIKEAKEIPDTPSPASIRQDSGDKVVESVKVKPKVLPPQVSHEDEKASMGKSKAELRAERRAKQEAQRAAKAAMTSNKATPAQEKVKSVGQGVPKAKPLAGVKAKPKQPSPNLKLLRKEPGDKLLSRLGWGDGRLKRSSSEDTTLKETQTIHPAIVQLSTRFTDRIVSGSNARCLAFVQAIKKAILDYQTPPQKELGRDLEARLLTPSLTYLESQRPHAVSVLNATKFLKWQLTQLQPLQQCSLENSSVPPAETKKTAVISDEEAKKTLIEGLDSYIWEKIEVAERAVCDTLRDKIKDGDVILTYGCSYLLQQILMGANKSGTKFKVVVVDGRPWKEGREMLRCLVAVGIPCSYVLLSAASSVMRQVNKVLLGAHALLSNGYVMSRVGVSQVALLASAHNVPVLVACETHKFCERVQSDSFVYNEMGEPDGLAQLLGGEDSPLSGWRSIPSLSLLNLSYDVTPPELVTAVATELAVLPCTSVPVVLRVRPAEPIVSRH